jgi:peptide/nickel transport system permease protein
MLAFLIRRILHGVVVLLIVTVFVFSLLHVLPGGPARAILGPKANPTEIAAFEQANNLNKPLLEQYFLWLGGVLHGNLGRSYNQNQTVLSLIAQRLPKTLVLTSLSLIVALAVGLPLGMLQAARRNGVTDRLLSVASLAMYSAPIFLTGILGIWLFAVRWRALPAQAPQGTSVLQILEDPKALVLPVLCLGLGSIAAFSRYMRSSTIENLVQDYVRLARAKGAGPARIMYRHVARNALGPVTTQVGLFLPILFAGTVITEAVFNYPGMGLLFWTAAGARDYPTELGVVLVVGVATVVGSLLADIAYGVLDPRIREASRASQ